MADVMQLHNLTASYSPSAVWLFRAVFPVFVTAVMDPEYVAECDHRIMRSEFPD